jgi:pyruvate/2-oxoglutarate dehydrogenase complex dihydrolipoamide acyltransferase (E2) component
MFRLDAPAAGRRAGVMAWVVMAGVLIPRVMFAQAAPAAGQPAAGQPAQQAAAAPAARVFASDGGMVLNFVKPDKGADFEAVMAKLKEALQKSEKPERKQQAQSWKVFKSPDPAAGGNVLYVFIIDPSVKGADYTVSTILAEAFPPAEVNELYKKYAESYATGQNFVNLTLVADLGK